MSCEGALKSDRKPHDMTRSIYRAIILSSTSNQPTTVGSSGIAASQRQLSLTHESNTENLTRPQSPVKRLFGTTCEQVRIFRLRHHSP